MIIYPNQGAGMCNRLHAAANLIAHSESTGNPALICSLSLYNTLFEGLPEKGFYFHHPQSVRKSKLRCPLSFIRSGSFPPGEIHFSVPAVVKAENAALMLFVGWRFRDDDALKTYSSVVRRIFTPVESCRSNITKVLSGLRSRCDRVVGVHIRRRDYKDFNGGIWYFDDTFYRSVMQIAVSQFPGRTGFVIASDEPVDLNEFSEFDVESAVGDPVGDLYSLAASDMIMGPPSTYSSWASFYGDIPLCHVTRETLGRGVLDFN
ncbi:MAG: hypothetical protein PF904_08000 [Kiritimatiellae bacterium]|jgi:hypothetical protein|nr:hypothetical protein [Kiritimatiellia bacterium]